MATKLDWQMYPSDTGKEFIWKKGDDKAEIPISDSVTEFKGELVWEVGSSSLYLCPDNTPVYNADGGDWYLWVVGEWESNTDNRFRYKVNNSSRYTTKREVVNTWGTRVGLLRWKGVSKTDVGVISEIYISSSKIKYALFVVYTTDDLSYIDTLEKAIAYRDSLLPEPPVTIDTVPAYSPQSIVNLVFQAGDSAEYPMGKFYVDRMQYSVNTESMRIDARNSIGKHLKDQTFDERNSYEVTKVSDMLEAILSGAGLSDYYVQPNNTLLGMEFAPNKDMLEGIEEVVQYIENWQIREEVSGRVVIADKTSSEFTQPSRYTFRRDRDIFSRDVSADDRSVYARVCVHTSDFSVKVYRPVNTNLGWNAPANKTLYQTVPDGTTSYEAAGIAVKLAESMANSGAIETFVCAFRPQIIPGDEAEILEEDESATMLGIITQVKHSFGTGGFFTEIVVDSGGRIGKPRLKEIIGTLAPPPASKRL